jgi:hypothetical protein
MHVFQRWYKRKEEWKEEGGEKAEMTENAGKKNTKFKYLYTTHSRLLSFWTLLNT